MKEQIPKYLVLVNWIKDKIESKELNPGEKLYSENELSTMFGMSRQTVRHAISELERENIVERRQGSGTYISNIFQKQRIDNTMNIAVVTTYVDDYIFPSIITGMEDVISKEGYTLQIAFTHNRVEKEYSVVRNIIDRNMADGLIIEPTKSGIPSLNAELYNEIINRGIPAVFFNSYYPEVDLPHVSLDDFQVGFQVAQYLIDAGHKDIAGIFKSDDRQGHLRYSGYVNCLTKAGISIKDENILWIDTEDLMHLSSEGKRVLRRLKGCSACLCYNDQVASEVEVICSKQDIKIPEELSLISVDNSEIAVRCEVPLTSVGHPKKELGKKAASQLIQMIKNGSKGETYEFQPGIIERNSVYNRL